MKNSSGSLPTDQLEKRAFGKTGMQVSALGLGGHELERLTPEQVGHIFDCAFEAGMNVIDTAECYGKSEELIGQALGVRRHHCYLFTKCGHAAGFDLPDWHPRLIEQSIERSLRRLKTDYLDLLQLHSCSQQVLQQGDVIEVLQRARAEGKVRYIGYSGDRDAALTAVKLGVFDALQISVNIADQEALDRVLPLAQEKQMGVIVKRSLANAAWKTQQAPEEPHVRTYWQRLRTLKYAFLKGQSDEIACTALNFTLSVPGVSVALIGTTRPERIVNNLQLYAKGPLPREQYEAIRARWKAMTWWRRWLPGGRMGWRGWT